jgi:hypothetical protein
MPEPLASTPTYRPGDVVAVKATVFQREHGSLAVQIQGGGHANLTDVEIVPWAERLAAIGALISPCGAPDVVNGYDLCPCGGGTWPCPTTRAAWLARGLDPEEQVRLAVAGWQREFDAMAADAQAEGTYPG